MISNSTEATLVQSTQSRKRKPTAALVPASRLPMLDRAMHDADAGQVVGMVLHELAQLDLQALHRVEPPHHQVRLAFDRADPLPRGRPA